MLESLFNKVVDLKAYKFIKKILQQRCFPVKFEKFLRTPFLQNTSGGCFCMCNFLFCMETYNTVQASEKRWLPIEMEKEKKKSFSCICDVLFSMERCKAIHKIDRVVRERSHIT